MLCRNASLEEVVERKNEELKEIQTKFHKLKEDFKYNLRLLNERDAELNKYDATYTGNNIQFR